MAIRTGMKLNESGYRISFDGTDRGTETLVIAGSFITVWVKANRAQVKSRECIR